MLLMSCKHCHRLLEDTEKCPYCRRKVFIPANKIQGNAFREGYRFCDPEGGNTGCLEPGDQMTIEKL